MALFFVHGKCQHYSESGQTSRQIRVLIVDDEPNVADLFNEATTRFGHRTAVALNGAQANGAQALRAVREFGPDVVLLDIRMRGIDGDNVARAPQTQPAAAGHHHRQRKSGRTGSAAAAAIRAT